MNPAEFAKWFLGRMRDFAPSLFYRGIYEYRVVKSGTDGRLDIEPTDPDEELSEEAKVEVWAGIAGYKVKPVVGTIILLAFIKGNLQKPRVVGFCPLSYTKPQEMQIDGDSILLGTSGHRSVVRKDDDIVTITAIPGGGLLFTRADGATFSITQVAGATPVISTIVPGSDPTKSGKLASYSTSKVKVQ